jgi:hypothetical protein
MAVKLVLIRFQRDDKQTLGKLFVIDDTGENLYECVTLELTWKDNQRNISCIPYSGYVEIDDWENPAGGWIDQVKFKVPSFYKVKKRYSNKHKNHLHILDVPGRTWILVHPGNFYTHIKGCILLGEIMSYINEDNYYDVGDSRKALNNILSILPDESRLYICEAI